MDFNKTFPLRYFINLGRRQDRRVEMEIGLAEAGITAERFPAVDARFVRKNRGYGTAGRYALTLTKRLILRRAMLKKADAVLLLEDDVIFHPEMLQRLAGMELPDDWGIFYLGCSHRERPMPVGEAMVRTRYALDMHAVAVRAPYYRKIIAALSQQANNPTTHARAGDWFFADLHKEIPTYACYPNLAWQAVNHSNLTGNTYSNYTSAGEQVASYGEMIGMQAEMWAGTRWKGWRQPIPPAPEPKLALLFLTRGDVNQPEIWREFVAEAKGDVEVYCHAKDRGAAEEGFLTGSQIEERHETAWGEISLVRAMLALVKAALKDSSITHFAFVSESCVPIKPWLEMRRRLKNDPRSMMRIQGSSDMLGIHMERLLQVKNLPDRDMKKHSQWTLLNREAAECLVEYDFTDHFSDVFAADEYYVGSTLALRGYLHGDRVNLLDPTWLQWGGNGGHPRSYEETTAELAAELANFPGFFARKFAPHSDIGKWGLHRGW